MDTKPKRDRVSELIGDIQPWTIVTGQYLDAEAAKFGVKRAPFATDEEVRMDIGAVLTRERITTNLVSDRYDRRGFRKGHRD